MAGRPRMRAALRGRAPGLVAERELWDAGHRVVAGLDEVGRGAWAGPLTFGRITAWAEAWSVGHASNDECDDLGMSDAQRLAARRALEGLGITVDRVLLDGRWDFVGGGRARTIVRGDSTSLSIAAASVVAKVTRDRILRDADRLHPGFGFAESKGYPSPIHRAALAQRGATTYHRRSWSFMHGLPAIGEPPRDRAGAPPRLF